jgi:hypothetical protein
MGQGPNNELEQKPAAAGCLLCSISTALSLLKLSIIEAADDSGTMHELPYRTFRTWLSDADLILLDIFFQGGASYRLLRRDVFCEQWNLVYSHGLSDDALARRLHELSERNVIEFVPDNRDGYFRMTVAGGELWSLERCPVWERYCTERYTRTPRGRTMMSVVAVSEQIRDDFLRLWLMYPARRRLTTIADFGLLRWRTFPQLYVGLATYHEQHRWTCEEYSVYVEKYTEHQRVLESQRSWWRFVSELQRFLAPAA